MDRRIKFATVWLGGCSGCHMSFLDLDEFLIDIAPLVEVVFSPVVDPKEYPEGVDVVLVEGAVCNEENLHMLNTVRRRSKTVVAFGDCAVTGNVSSMRNPLCAADCCLKRAYLETADLNPQLPVEEGIVPVLFDKVLPIHEVVPVDFFLPGCPPSAGRIRKVLEQLLAGETPHLDGRELKFG
jgi:NAD-reducing hydrogenase small subunit